MNAAPFVDYSAARLVPMPRRAEPHRRETVVPVHCPLCGGTRDLTLANARAAGRSGYTCGTCQRVAAGKRGFAATLALYPRMRWQIMDKVADYRKANPSSLEQIVQDALDRLGIYAYREAKLATRASSVKRQRIYLIDFLIYLPSGPCAVEVDGAYWHNQPDQQRRDRAKRALMTRRGIRHLRLDEKDIRAGRALAILQNFLQREAS
jgi:very-short-patch-repair endonuclease